MTKKNLIAKIKGVNGTLFIYEDVIEISRSCCIALLQNLPRKINFSYSDIKLINYRSATLYNNGYFIIITDNHQMIEINDNFFGSSPRMLKRNVVILRAFKKSTAEKHDHIYKLALAQLSKIQNSNY